jgi:hypothetical protein
MGYLFDFEYNGTIIRAYCKLTSVTINTIKKNFGFSSKSKKQSEQDEVIKPFYLEINYSIHKNKNEEQISVGNITMPYDINSSNNIYEYAYQQLKNKLPNFSEAEEV